MAKSIELASQQDLNAFIAGSDDSLHLVYVTDSKSDQCKRMETVVSAYYEDPDFCNVVIGRADCAKVDQSFGEALISQYNAIPHFVFCKQAQKLESMANPSPAVLMRRVTHWLDEVVLPVDLEKDFKAAQGDGLSSVESLNERLRKLTTRSPVILFMKGDPSNPQCKFSRAVVSLLKEANAEYDSFDILQDEEVRQGLKAFSNWPTFPQLYVDGKLIGGLDIMKEMHELGELEQLVSAKPPTSCLSLDDRLRNLISRSRNMLFMKGDPSNPQCKFSKAVVALLSSIGVKYDSFDILQDEEVRQGLKTFSNWPTFPQLYVDGKLIGGLDIMKEMNELGELASLMQETTS